MHAFPFYRFHQIPKGMNRKRIVAEIFVCRHIHDFHLLIPPAEHACRIDTGNPFHIDIQKDQVIIYARIQQCFPAGITVDLKQRFKFFQIFFHLLQHTFLIITDSYFHFFLLLICPQYISSENSLQSLLHKRQFFCTTYRKGCPVCSGSLFLHLSRLIFFDISNPLPFTRPVFCKRNQVICQPSDRYRIPDHLDPYPRRQSHRQNHPD